MAHSDSTESRSTEPAGDAARMKAASVRRARSPSRAMTFVARLHPARLWRALASPYYRYRNARLIHSIRVGLAMMASILATTGIDLPHGIWASVTVLVVIGGLQHHGNIRKKATERSLGTLLGAGIGLALLVVQAFTHSLVLTYVLMSIVAAVCGWHAIGKAGYVGLLTAITMCIVAGHGDNLIDTGLWRTLNVMVGIVIALAFSFALPLHATYSWRYRLADNLRDCARVYAQIVSGASVDADAQARAFLRMNQRLVQLRALMPSVAGEIDVPVAKLEQIQRLHRSLLSALEIMSMGMLRYEQHVVEVAFGRRGTHVRAALLKAARALRYGGAREPEVAARALRPLPAPSGVDGAVTGDALGDHAPHAPEIEGPYWLGLRLEEQVDQLRALLLQTEPRWNIERASAHRMV